jgi:hypothetical protein
MSFYYPAADAEINLKTTRSPAIKIIAGLSFIGCMIAGVLLFFHVPAALPASSQGLNWAINDITYINPVISPEAPLIAVYGRKLPARLQIRLDFIAPIPKKIELILTSSATRQTITAVSRNGQIQVQPDQFRTQLTLAEADPGQDALIYNLTAPGFVIDPNKTTIQVNAGDAPGSNNWLSYPKVPLFSSNAVSTTHVILAFWDVFPAAAPSQILRRWDGAHTGPFGQRHGLKQLIAPSQAYQIPLLLLDLNQPESLSGLDLLQKMPEIKSGMSTGLLNLPTSDSLMKTNQPSEGASINDLWGIKNSSLVYHSTNETGEFSPTICINNRFNPCILVKTQQNEIDRFGLTKAGKWALASSLDNSASIQPLIFGGDLPTSPWADSFSAPKAFRYLASHPWIKIWDENDINLYLQKYPSAIPWQSNSSGPKMTANPFYTNNAASAQLALLNAHPGSLTAQAWHTYFDLTSQPENPQLKALRAHYFIQIGQLLLASDWAQHPTVLNQAIQLGPSSLYIVSDQDHFLLIDTNDGSLILAVTLKNNGPQLIIAPTSLFAVGLSAPDTWSDRGKRSDPAVIPGAFWDDSAPIGIYRYTPIPNGLTFQSASGITKTFKLSGEQLQVICSSSITVKTSIPLVINPDRRFKPGYRQYLNQLSAKPPFQLDSNVPFNQTMFYDSINLLDQSENPDLEYPASLLLPVPTGKVELTIPAGKQVQFTIKLVADN